MSLGVDTNYYYPQPDGSIGELDDWPVTSSELLLRHLSAAYVVKVFNNIFFGTGAQPPVPVKAVLLWQPGH